MPYRTAAPIPPVTLHDGRVVSVRSLQPDDKTRLLQFGHVLPQDDWLYLEHDLRSPEIVARLTNASAAEHWRQMVAIENDQIVAYASVRLSSGRTSHVATVQLIIGEGWRRVGLGRAMGTVIFEEAKKMHASKVVVEMLEAQRSGQAIFARLGFRIEGTLINHARDRFGKHHNLVVMATLVDDVNYRQ
ncbi:MAG: GNAT family N-acetyltransferase [Chloroflexales bacterium]|nr:GNAT family N-acetyltransferase [Chloroflexales bacterium]